jgi:hypothetical protein
MREMARYKRTKIVAMAKESAMLDATDFTSDIHEGRLMGGQVVVAWSFGVEA